jgi:hypothetical protein
MILADTDGFYKEVNEKEFLKFIEDENLIILNSSHPLTENEFICYSKRDEIVAEAIKQGDYYLVGKYIKEEHNKAK